VIPPGQAESVPKKTLRHPKVERQFVNWRLIYDPDVMQ
jgi:hypothetical protein